MEDYDESCTQKQMRKEAMQSNAKPFCEFSHLLFTTSSTEAHRLCLLLMQIRTSRVRRIRFLYFLLVCFPFANGIHSNSHLSRWTPLPDNLCSKWNELKSCPNTEYVRQYRERVCLGVTIHDDSYELYHCQYDNLYNRIYEFVMEPFSCPKGYYGKVQYKSQLRCSQQHCVRIVCTPCPNDRYQPEATKSPQSLRGCHYARKVIRPEDHLILFQKGNTSSPDIYYCDFLNGFYNEYKQIFCNGHHPCRCVSRYERPVCPPSFDTLPDGTCRSKCLYPRLPRNKFECYSDASSSKPVQLHNYTTPVTISNTTDNTGFDWMIIVYILVAVVSVLIVVLFVMVVYRYAIPRMNAMFMNVRIQAHNIFHLRGRKNIVNNNQDGE